MWDQPSKCWHTFRNLLSPPFLLALSKADISDVIAHIVHHLLDAVILSLSTSYCQ
jgi:hypothetical protein